MPLTTPTREDVRAALNRWDPIDILDAANPPPVDEYDELIDPLRELLSRSDARQQLIDMLQHRMRETYGLDPELLGVPAFADQLLALTPAP